MTRLWAGLHIGDVVSLVGRSKQMMVVDLPPDESRVVICGWRTADGVREGVVRASALVVIQRARQT